MRRALAFTLLLLTLPSTIAAADTRYVSDKQFIPLRSGPGGNYRITHRGIPSGTRLDVKRTSDDGEYAEITTAKGTSGWIRTQYLMKELPAQNKLAAAEAKAESLARENSAVKKQATALKSERATLVDQISSTSGSLDATTQELAQLKQISSKSVQLDIDNRRLGLETEELRSEVEMLEAENQRLQDNLDSEAFLNGAFAVILGVIVALVVPRLWPTRRRNSSWA